MVDEIIFPSEFLIPIPEIYIQALKNMEEYDSFCVFCYLEWIHLGKDTNTIGTYIELLDKFFNL